MSVQRNACLQCERPAVVHHLQQILLWSHILGWEGSGHAVHLPQFLGSMGALSTGCQSGAAHVASWATNPYARRALCGSHSSLRGNGK